MVKNSELGPADFAQARLILDGYEAVLKELLAACNTRHPQDDGIPAILIVDDFTANEKTTRTPSLADVPFNQFYADLGLALAILVEAEGGDPDYPSICPAMSAIAEHSFCNIPFRTWDINLAE
jgi:hypothetical protein